MRIEINIHAMKVGQSIKDGTEFRSYLKIDGEDVEFSHGRKPKKYTNHKEALEDAIRRVRILYGRRVKNGAK